MSVERNTSDDTVRIAKVVCLDFKLVDDLD